MKGEEDLSEKRKFRREIEVEKNTVTKVSDVMTRISGKVDGWENVEDHWKGDTEHSWFDLYEHTQLFLS